MEDTKNNNDEKKKFTLEEIEKAFKNLSDEDRMEFYMKYVSGDTKGLSDLFITELLKEDKLSEKYKKILSENFMDFQKRFYKLSFPAKIQFYLSHEYYNMIYHILTVYALRSLNEGPMDSEDQKESLKNIFLENIENDVKSYMNTYFGSDDDKNKSE